MGSNATYIPPAHVGSHVGSHVGLIGTLVGSARLFGYQHVGMSNAKWSRWGSKPTGRPNMSGVALQWNIGFAF